MELTIKDINEILAIENDIFSTPYSREIYHELLHNNPQIISLKIEKDEQLVGYALMHVLFEQANLLTIGIKRSYQHQGLGQQLLIDIMKEVVDIGVNTIFLEVRVSNIAAIKLYKKLGFIQNRLRENYYGIEDGIEMIWRKETI